MNLSNLKNYLNGCISDGVPSGMSNASILELVDQLEAAQKDAARLNYMIDARATVCHDETIADGYWLDFQKPDGSRWVQVGDFDSPRNAIDAAMSSQA